MADTALLIEDIHNGAFDDDLRRVIEACYERTEVVRKIRAAQIQPGDEVKFVNLRPQYLQKITGATLIEVADGTARVQLPESARNGRGFPRYYGPDLVMKVPATCIAPA